MESSVSEFNQIKSEFLERLRGVHITEKELDEIAQHLCDFRSAVVANNIGILLRTVTLLYDITMKAIDTNFAKAFCDRLQCLIPAGITNGKVPLASKQLFFVWIGCISNRSMRNILVWKKANPEYNVQLWYDSRCLLATFYIDLIKHRCEINLTTNRELICFQNEVYASLESAIAKGTTFDDGLIRHFRQIGLRHISRKLQLELNRAKRFYRVISKYVDVRDLQDYATEIMSDEFCRYYFREVGLRGNLAAASDILRLHLIQHYGGIYIDCDTLPSMRHLFQRTDHFCECHNTKFSFIDVLKSELYMQRLAGIIDFPEPVNVSADNESTRQVDMGEITSYLRRHYGALVNLMTEEANAITPENALKPLDEIWLLEQGLALSSDPYNQNCFNNNVLVANQKAKSITIILFEIRRRYRYLDRMNAVKIASEEEVPIEDSYRGRLLNYRFDTLDERENVTVILTGSGLIFEVVVGLGFRFLKLNDDVEPISLSYALYSQKIGIAFVDQTFHTYDHSQSTWMRDPDGHALLV